MEIGEETRVLIVDDFNTSRRMNRQTLKDLGTELCNEVKDPDEAIKLLERYQYHLVLVDWYMDGSRGVDLVKQIRETHSKKSLPALLMLMDPLDDQLAMGKAAGISGHILKPFDAGTLSKTLMGFE